MGLGGLKRLESGLKWLTVGLDSLKRLESGLKWLKSGSKWFKSV